MPARIEAQGERADVVSTTSTSTDIVEDNSESEEENDVEMVFSNDHENEEPREKPKGIKVVLQERGLWKEGWKLQCAPQNIYKGVLRLFFSRT